MIFDLVVALIVIVSAVIAFLRGLVREVLTILGVVGGLVAAYFLGPVVAPVIRGWFGVDGQSPEQGVENTQNALEGSVGSGGEEEAAGKLFDILPYEMLADGLAYGGVFIVFVIVLSVLSHFLSLWVKAIGLGPADRIFGVMFGFLRGVALVVLLYLLPYLVVEEQTRKDWFKGSYSLPHVEKMTEWTTQFLSEKTALEKMKEGAGDIAEGAQKTMEEIDLDKLKDKAGQLKKSDKDAAPEGNGEE